MSTTECSSKKPIRRDGKGCSVRSSQEMSTYLDTVHRGRLKTTPEVNPADGTTAVHVLHEIFERMRNLVDDGDVTDEEIDKNHVTLHVTEIDTFDGLRETVDQTSTSHETEILELIYRYSYSNYI